jgi:flagellar basal-body rod modification protein FlgD
MATAAGIFNHQLTAGQALTGTSPQAASTANANSATDTSSSSSTVSANDFLTLLVTELKNQDPTAASDPNEYVNQLVAVNSLEQLININSTLTSAVGSSTAAAASKSSPTGVNATGASQPATAAQPTTSDATTASSARIRFASGNLSTPASNAAAQRVANALSGQQ